MNRLAVPPHLRDFRHAIFRQSPLMLVGPQDVTPDSDALSVSECITRYGEPICSCATFILEWTPPEYIGRSDATDGANR